jgi:hypothetical protein
MPDKPIRKGFNILEEVEEIHRKKLTRQLHKESANLIQSQLISALRIQSPTQARKLLASVIWAELLEKTREFPKHEFQDDISELRQEVDTLKLEVKSFAKRLESSNLEIVELSKKISKENSIRQATITSLDKLCNTYVEMVSKVEIVKKIYVVKTQDGLVCWTVIDAEPFDSELRAPIYDAQVKIYQEMKEDIALDFHVLNLSELHDRQELESILPPGAKLVWQR